MGTRFITRYQVSGAKYLTHATQDNGARNPIIMYVLYYLFKISYHPVLPQYVHA